MSRSIDDSLLIIQLADDTNTTGQGFKLNKLVDRTKQAEVNMQY